MSQIAVSDIKPLPGYLLVQPTPQQKQTQSGLYLPDNVDEKPQDGQVLAVGADATVDGQKVSSPVKKGDRVIYKKWGGNEIKIDDIEYQLLKFEDVLATIK